jgi:hypothetical protein
MALSYHSWLDMAAVLFLLAFPAMNVEDPLSASVLNASMKIKGVCVMCAQSIMHAVRRCFCHRSALREQTSLGILGRYDHPRCLPEQ